MTARIAGAGEPVIGKITRRETLVGTAAALGATAAPVASSLAAHKDDRHLKAMWRDYLQALANHSAARARYEAAMQAADEDVRDGIEAIDARVEAETSKLLPQSRTANVRVEGVELTEQQLESVRGIVSAMLRSENQQQADISEWARQENERLRDDAEKLRNLRALDDRQDRTYMALESIAQCIMDAKAYTVEGAAIKLSLAAMRARDGFVAEKELLAGYEALLEIAGLDDLAAAATDIGRHTDTRVTMSPFLTG